MTTGSRRCRGHVRRLGAGRVVAVTGTGKDRRVVGDFGAAGKKTVFAKSLDPASRDGMN